MVTGSEEILLDRQKKQKKGASFFHYKLHGLHFYKKNILMKYFLSMSPYLMQEFH